MNGGDVIRRPRVAMIVDNDVTHDARVLKTAATAAAAGCDVLVVGQSRGSRRWETEHGDALRIVRVPLLDGGSPLARVLAHRVAPGAGRAAALRRRAADGTLLPVLRGRVAERLPHRLYPGWRNVFPQFVALRRASMPLLAAFAPDLVHAHDLPALDAAAHVRGAALVYDAHEYTRGLDSFSPTRHRACIDAEAEHIGAADRIITVSPRTAELLQADYHLPYRPDVVFNPPPATAAQPAGGLRSAVELAPSVPLLVYSGEVKPARGLDAVVDALPALPDAHLALVSDAASPGVRALQARAQALGVAGRVHVLPYVAAHAVSELLVADADLGISALVHYGNAEATLPTKLFDYLQARLPVVVSDVRASRELVAAVGFGEPFRAGDAGDFARAARLVLARPERYRPGAEALATYAWERQSEELLRVYAALLGPEARLGPAAPERVTALLADASVV